VAREPKEKKYECGVFQAERYLLRAGAFYIFSDVIV
jgi:hypothetical protein